MWVLWHAICLNSITLFPKEFTVSQSCMSGTLLHHHLLKKYTSWQVGGPADRVYFPETEHDLSEFLASLPPQEPLLWLGLGSNVLIRDGGIRGTVIITQKGLRQIDILSPTRWRVQTGMPCGTLARTSAREGLTGLEFLAGIPGTLGGAVAMNAGCHGGETWDHLVAVCTIDRSGEIKKRSRADFEVAYREVKRPQGEWFLNATFELPLAPPEQCKQTIKDLLAYRAQTQPTHLPSGGSVFRNPPGDHAGRLIESCGLKGCQMGQAMVSPKHANFIVSLNDHTRAADIEGLMHYVQEHVFQKTGIRLQAEVHVLGDDLPCTSYVFWDEEAS